MGPGVRCRGFGGYAPLAHFLPRLSTAPRAGAMRQGAYLIYREHCTVLPINWYAPLAQFLLRLSATPRAGAMRAPRWPRFSRQVHARLCLTGATTKNTGLAAIPPMRICDVVLPIRTSPPKQKSENQAKFDKVCSYDIPSNLHTCCRRGEISPAGIALLLEKHCENFWR